MRLSSLVLVTLLGLPLAACAGSQPAAVSPPPELAGEPAPTAAAADPNAPIPRTLKRSQVKAAVAQGLGVYLQRVALDEEPVMAGGKFRGFRLKALRGDPNFWRGIDLRPGDVITQFNGASVERPDTAFEAWKKLEAAAELRIDYERDGQPKAIVYPIVED